MKKLLTLLLASLVLAGFTTGCKNKPAEETPAAQDQQQQQEAQPPAEEETNKEDENAGDDQDEESDQEDGDDGVDEEVFVKAAYEVSCVKSKISDPEEQKEILAVVYPRYGFETVEEYAAAESSFKDSDSVKSALAELMKGCTEEAAKGFKTGGSDEAKEKDGAEAEKEAPQDNKEKPAEEKKAAPKHAYEDGNFNNAIKHPKIKDGMLKCNAYRGTIRCQVTGEVEGKGFAVNTSGKIADNGLFTINGTHGDNRASISGKLKGKNGSGKISLNIFERDYNGTW